MRVIAPGSPPVDLGIAETSPTIGIIDYSRRETDEFGATTVVERGFARRMTVKFALPSGDVDTVHRRVTALRATAAQWIADERFAWLSFDGFYKDFSLDLQAGSLSYCSLTIEGLAETEPGEDLGGDPAPEGRASSLMMVQPVAITPAILTASNVPEADYSEWSSVATYGASTRVIVSAAHRIYESVVAGNVGNDPQGDSGKWIVVGPTNRWAMFDEALGTLTTRAGGITVTLNPGAGVTALALLDVTGTSVRVQRAGYDRTIAVGDGAMAFLDLPGTAAPITVTISGAGAVSVGTLLVGRLVRLGVTGDAPTAGINDYSRKEVDDFGEVTVVPRAWSKRMATNALIRTDALDVVADRIAAVRARPALWIADEGTDCLTIYGFFKDFSIEAGPNVSTLALTVEGLSEAAPIGGGLPPVSWPDIVDTDPAHPKPEDGATVGGTVGENIKDESGNVLDADDLITSEGTAKDVDYIGGVPTATFKAGVAQAQQDIAALFDTYGDTASAAASAAAANAAKTAAETAKANAEQARDDAQDARDLAAGHASGAATSSAASIAAKNASEAAKTAAETARTQAQTAATNAGGSASAAAGHAATASTKATDAGNAATAANASAVTANTKAGEALASSSAAASSASTAQGAANAATSQAALVATTKSGMDTSLSDAFPRAINPDTLTIAAAVGGPTAALSRLADTHPAYVGPNRAYVDMPQGRYDFTLRGLIPVEAGTVIRVTADVEQTVSVAAKTSCTVYLAILDADLNILGQFIAGSGGILNLAQGERALYTRVIGYNAPGLADYNVTTAGARYFRIRFLVNRVENGTASTSTSATRIHSIYPEIISAQKAAEQASSAAATSAGAALTSKTAAETAASAANTAKVAAESARDNAAGSAAASSASASTAATKASEAMTSASAANDAKNLAITAKGQAETASGQAATARDTAQGHAATASAQSTLAASSAEAARLAAQRTLPSTFEDGTAYFKGSYTSANPTNAKTGVDPTYGAYFEVDSPTINTTIATRGRIPCKIGQKFKVRALMQHISGTASAPNIRLEQFAASVGGTVLGVPNSTRPSLTSTTPVWVGDDTALTTTIDGFIGACVVANSSPAQAIQRVYALELIDVDALEQAKAQALAAATSASTASTKATEAGASATSATSSMNTATTKAGEASVSAGQAAASASGAAGSAVSAATSATLSAAYRDAAASNATGNIVWKGNWQDGAVGGWTGATSVVDVTAAPNGATKALRSTNRDTVETPTRSGDFAGRKYRLTGYVMAPGSFQARVGIRFQNAAGASSFQGQYLSPAGTTTWQAFDFEVTGSAGAVSLAPWLNSEGASGAAGHDVRLAALHIDDVTESKASSSAATVATNQAALADTHKSAAQTSANLAAGYRDAAGLAAGSAFPETLSGAWMTALISGAPASRPDFPGGVGLLTDGIYTSPVGVSGANAYYKAVVPWAVGKIYELQVDVEAIAGSGGSVQAAPYARVLTSAYAQTTPEYYSFSTLTVGTRTTLTLRFGFGVAVSGGINIPDNSQNAFVRLGALINYGTAANRQTKVYRLSVRDVTELVATETNASVAASQAATASAQASLAQSRADLAATHSSNAHARAASRGLTPNADFDAGLTLWTRGGSVQATHQPAYQGRSNVAASTAGASSYLTSAVFDVDPTRKYRLRWGLHNNSSATPRIVYLGLYCRDAAGAVIGSNSGVVYAWSGNPNTGWTDGSSAVITGEQDANGSGGWAGGFRAGTRKVAVLAYLNYSNAAGVEQALDYAYLEDVTESETSLAQANVSTSQAAIATAQAAAAKMSAELAASVGTGAMNPNAGFDDYPSATVGQFPAKWTLFTGMGGAYRVADGLGGYSMRVPAAANTQVFFSSPASEVGSVRQNDYVVLKADLTLNSGALTDARALGRVANASNVDAQWLYLTFSTDPDATGTAPGAGVAGTRYKFTKLVKITAAAASRFQVYGQNHGSTTNAANDITWHELSWRPATPAEIAAGTVLPDLQSTVSSQASVLSSQGTQLAALSTTVSTQGASIATQQASLNGLAVRYSMTLDVNGHITGFEQNNNGSSGNFIVRADTFAVAMPGVTPRVIFGVDATGALINGDLRINTGKIVVDTGAHMKVIGKGFGTSGQFIEWFGPKMAFNLCSEANAISYIKTNGDAYFGGALTLGTLKSGNTSPSTATNAAADTGTIGSNGGNIVVTCSWTYTSSTTSTFAHNQFAAFEALATSYNATGSGPGGYYSGSKSVAVSPATTLTLARKVGTGSLTNVQSTSVTSRTDSFTGTAPLAGDTGGSATITTTVSASFTYTDTTQSTNDRQFTLTLNRTFTGAGAETQRVSIQTIEE